MTWLRRDFLKQLGVVFLLPSRLLSAKESSCDVAIIGGGTGGCAAALAAARNGMRVILVEETDWIGGQLTSQAVPPDEHPWIETFGATRLYRSYRNAVREYYRRNYPLTEEARSRWNLNPGDGRVSRLTHVAHAIQTGNPPRRIRNDEKLLKEFQSKIQSQRVEISWPMITPR